MNQQSILMRLEWTVYAFTSGLFFAIGVLMYIFEAGPEVAAAVFAILTVLYGWVAWVMVKRAAVLELHAYQACASCSTPTPIQGAHCMNCGTQNANFVPTQP